MLIISITQLICNLFILFCIIYKNIYENKKFKKLRSFRSYYNKYSNEIYNVIETTPYLEIYSEKFNKKIKLENNCNSVKINELVFFYYAADFNASLYFYESKKCISSPIINKELSEKNYIKPTKIKFLLFLRNLNHIQLIIICIFVFVIQIVFLLFRLGLMLYIL